MKRILVVDDEPDILDIMVMACEMSCQAQISTANSGNTAINILKEDPNFSVIFCDYRMKDGNGGDVYNFLTKEKIKIPYVMVSSDLPSQHPELANLAGYVEKPKIVEGVRSFLAAFEVQTRDKNAPVKKPSYLPVRIKNLLNQSPLKTSLFVKLSEEKFVKLYKDGDIFGLEDAEKMTKRNIANLYVPENEVGIFLKSFGESYGSILTAKQLPPSSALKITENTSHIIQNCFTQFGWNPDLDKLAKNNLELCQRMVQNEKNLGDLFKKLSADPGNYFASRSTLMSFFTLGAASAMGWASELNQYKLTLASQLHDVGLTPEESTQYQSLMRTTMNSSPEIDHFKKHPSRAADLIKASPSMPPDLDRLVLVHHERPDGVGFPGGLGFQEIDQLSALFIICGNLVDFIIGNERKLTYQAFFEKYADLYLKGTFKEVFQMMGQNLK